MIKTPEDQAELKKLFEQYRDNLPRRIALIETLWQELKLKPSKNLLIDLHMAIHNLNGSSGTYGYDEIESISDGMIAIMKQIKQDMSLLTEHDGRMADKIQTLKNLLTNDYHENAFHLFLKKNLH